jgi:hypothetical protein
MAKRAKLPSAEEIFGDPTGARAASIERLWTALGIPTNQAPADETPPDEAKDWDIDSWQSPRAAPTSAPTKKHRDPRATKIAYNNTKNILVVRFFDGTWWQYEDVSLSDWSDLKSSGSTGKWIHSHGLNAPGSGSEFDPGDMPPSVRVLFNA